jgi:hypothetical protein
MRQFRSRSLDRASGEFTLAAPAFIIISPAYPDVV